MQTQGAFMELKHLNTNVFLLGSDKSSQENTGYVIYRAGIYVVAEQPINPNIISVIF